MATLTVRHLPDDIHRALRLQASRNGRSTEAEAREILVAAVKPPVRVRLGDAMAALSLEIGLANEDVEALELAMDKMPSEPFEV